MVYASADSADHARVVGDGGRAARDTCRAGDGRGDPPRRRVHRGGLAAGPGGHRLPAARAERRRRRHLPDGSPHRLRRDLAVRRRHRARSRAGEASSVSARGATTDRRRTGSACSSTRSTTGAARSSSPSTRRASSRTRTGSTTATRTTGGTRCGTSPVSRTPDGWRAEFRIPFSQLRFQPVRVDDVRPRVRAPDRPPQRDLDLAAALEERERLRVVVRRADRPPARSIAEAARNGAVRRRRRDAAAGRGRQPADEGNRSGCVASAST